MSTISFSNNYVSSNYHVAAKSQHVAAIEAVKNNNNTSDIVSPTGDVLTISAEVLEVLNKNGDVLTISAEELEAEKVKLGNSKQLAEIESLSCEEFNRAILDHSNHSDLGAWAFGVSFADNYKANAELLYSKYQSDLQNADKAFAQLLERNNIKLSKEEHIELTIDYDGNLTVNGNISKEKSERIQNALNNDNSLEQNLLMAHGNRKYSEENIDSSNTSYLENQRSIVNTILQREYGLSLSDFELNKDYKSISEFRMIGDYQSYHKPYESLNIKNGNNTLLEELYNNERKLFLEISRILYEQKNSPDAEVPDVTFSYQNGVFVEKGKNDAKTLDTFASKVMRCHEVIEGEVDYSITFDNSGRIMNTTQLSKDFRKIILAHNKNSFNEDTWSMYGNYFNSQVYNNTSLTRFV
jgi:hypothetical protein